MGAGQSRDQFGAALEILLTREVDWGDAVFWNELWDVATTAEDVFSFLGPEEVERLLRERPSNLRHVCSLAVAQLCQFVETPLPIYFDNALNCIRVLTRVMPTLVSAEGSDFVEATFWEDGEAEEGSEASDAAVAGGVPDGMPDGQSEDSSSQAHDPVEPMATLLVHAVMHLLFVPGFTIDEESELAEEGVALSEMENWKDPLKLPMPSIVWHPGVGTSLAYPHGGAFDANRVEVLRLLLVLLSEPIFGIKRGRWLSLATAMDSPFASTLFLSLLNTVTAHDPAGWAWGVPFTNLVAGGEAAALASLSVQVLAVLLDWSGAAEGAAGDREGAGAAEEKSEEDTFEEKRVDPNAQQSGAAAAPPSAPASRNIFHHLARRIAAAEEFDLLFLCFARVLNNLHEANSAILPGSVGQTELHQELLVLLWKLLELCPAFEAHVLARCDVCRLVTPICYLMLESRRDPSRVGLIHVCTFLLLRMSGERDFAVKLNAPFRASLPVDLPLFHRGCHADLLLVTLHKLIVNAQPGLQSMYNCFLIIAANISPYVKSIALVAAVKLVSLFELFTAPRFLYAAEANHLHVARLLELFNNVVQYQYAGNPHLVYALVKRSDAFRRLRALELPEAVAAAASARRPARFVPTAEWLKAVKGELPMATLRCLLEHLEPRIERMCEMADGAAGEAEVVDFIRNTTLVGILPVPHPITIRKYQANQYTQGWFTAFLWGVVFLRNQQFPLFNAEDIRLFKVTNNKGFQEA